MDLTRTAHRLGVSRHDVLELLARYKPVAAALEMQRMRRAPEPRIDQVDPRARDAYVRWGQLLGVPDPRRATWDDLGARIANRIGAAYYVDGDTLWLWSAAASTEEDQRATAIGIRTIPGGQGHYDVLDWRQAEVGRVGSLKAAEAIASRVVRRTAPMDACAA